MPLDYAAPRVFRDPPGAGVPLSPTGTAPSRHCPVKALSPKGTVTVTGERPPRSPQVGVLGVVDVVVELMSAARHGVSDVRFELICMLNDPYKSTFGWHLLDLIPLRRF